MFKPEPWAKAFVNASETAAEESLEYLRIFCRAALTLPGYLSGRNDADRLGKAIKAALVRTNSTEPHSAILSERFMQLMIRKNCFNHYKQIICEIEKIIYKQNGIEEVIVETAVEPDDSFLEAVRAQAKQLIKAKEIKLTRRLIPELIGGLRLRWGSKLYDSSVKYRLQKMAADLGTLNDRPGHTLEAK